MPKMFRLRFQWKDNATPPESRELVFVTSGARVISKLTAALQTEVAPTLGESCTINITSVGDLRDTA